MSPPSLLVLTLKMWHSRFQNQKWRVSHSCHNGNWGRRAEAAIEIKLLQYRQAHRNKVLFKKRNTDIGRDELGNGITRTHTSVVTSINQYELQYSSGTASPPPLPILLVIGESPSPPEAAYFLYLHRLPFCLEKVVRPSYSSQHSISWPHPRAVHRTNWPTQAQAMAATWDYVPSAYWQMV